MMSCYRVTSQALGQMVRDALGQAPCVYEDERGRMLIGELREAIVNFAPHFIRGHGTEFARGHFDRKIHLAAMADLHDGGIVVVRASQEVRNRLDGFLRGGEADAGESLAGELVQALERKGQMRAALVVSNGVNFIDDNGFDRFEYFAALRGG